MHLDGIKACVDRVAGGAGKVIAGAFEVGDRRGRHEAFGRRAEPTRRRQRAGPVGPGVGHETRVPDLCACGGAFGMHGVGDAAQRHCGVVVEDEAVPVHAATRRDRAVGDR